jgi:hypothetical protein
MENIEIVEVESPVTQTIQEFVIIDRGNGEFTSMLKSDYEKQQAEQSTPNLAP